MSAKGRCSPAGFAMDASILSLDRSVRGGRASVARCSSKAGTGASDASTILALVAVMRKRGCRLTFARAACNSSLRSRRILGRTNRIGKMVIQTMMMLVQQVMMVLVRSRVLLSRVAAYTTRRLDLRALREVSGNQDVSARTLAVLSSQSPTRLPARKSKSRKKLWWIKPRRAVQLGSSGTKAPLLLGWLLWGQNLR